MTIVAMTAMGELIALTDKTGKMSSVQRRWRRYVCNRHDGVAQVTGRPVGGDNMVWASTLYLFGSDS